MAETEIKDAKEAEVKEVKKPDKEAKEEEIAPPTDEEIALEHGWKDFKSYVEAGGDPKRFVSAVRFNARGDFIAEKLEMKSQLNEQRSLTMALVDQNRKLDSAYRAELVRKEKAAKSDLDAAIDLGDKKAAQEAVAAIEDIKTEKANAEKPAAERPRNSAAMDKFMEENEWLNWPVKGRVGDDAATAYAVKLDDMLRPAIGVTYSSEAEVLTEIKKRVLKRFPEYDKGRKTDDEERPAKKSPPIGGEASSKRAGGSEKGLSANNLNQEERAVMNNLVRAGIMTEKQYLEQYEMIRRS